MNYHVGGYATPSLGPQYIQPHPLTNVVPFAVTYIHSKIPQDNHHCQFLF